MAAAMLVRFEDLKPGDHLRITQRVKVGSKIWQTVVSGTVIRTERRRNGVHVKRNFDDRVFSDMIVLRKDGPINEETTVNLDEFTHLERA